MKTLRMLLAALFLATGAAAQNPTAYFMEGSTFRTQFNPAFAPLRGYFNIPAAGGIDVNMNSSLALDDVLYPRNGKLVTIFDRSVTADEALRNIKENNLLGLDVRTNILGFGKFTRNRKNFWAFDINLHAAAGINLPKSLFEFVKRGEEGVIRNFGATASTYLDAGFSYSFPLLGEKLYVGAKAKVLVGLARAKVNFDYMTSPCTRIAGPSKPRDRSTPTFRAPRSTTAPTNRSAPTSASTTSASAASNPPATDSPSTWARRTTYCPTCKCRWRSPIWDS